MFLCQVCSAKTRVIDTKVSSRNVKRKRRCRNGHNTFSVEVDENDIKNLKNLIADRLEQIRDLRERL